MSYQHNQPNVVVIGGGHGLANMLRGLKKQFSNITAIVTVSDDGGNSGQLRDELGMLPPGDIRNCIAALAKTEPTMDRLLNYRFTEGTLTGQCFGNLFLAAMNGISDSFDEAVRKVSSVLAIQGRVLPVTNSNIHLEAEFDNGERCLGESKIFYAKKVNNCRIRQVRLVPEHPPALPESIEAIRTADIILMGPGSLYTSIIPNFLVQGIGEAVAQSHALRIFIMNIMAQDGETEGYSGYDHIKAFLEHAPHTLDVCLANNKPLSAETLKPYEMEGVGPIELEREKIEALGIEVREYPFAKDERYIRHDCDVLTEAVAEIYQQKNGR